MSTVLSVTFCSAEGFAESGEQYRQVLAGIFVFFPQKPRDNDISHNKTEEMYKYYMAR